MIKEMIKVGRIAMLAETVPVKVIYSEDAMPYDSFKMIEVDGIYIVIKLMDLSHQDGADSYKAFLLEKDAWSYLEMFGIEREDES